MKEYQFKVPNGVWLDVHADSEKEAVETLNADLHLLEEPLPAPGRIQRVQIDIRKPITAANIVSVYDFDMSESHTHNDKAQISSEV